MRRTGLLHRIVYGPPAGLRSYEELAIHSVLKQLKDATASKFATQLRNLPYRQRHSDDRVLAFFPDRGVYIPPEASFANKQDDLIFATVELDSGIPNGQKLRAKLIAAEGFFFSVEFEDTPDAKGILDGGPAFVSNVAIVAELDPPNPTEA